MKDAWVGFGLAKRAQARSIASALVALLKDRQRAEAMGEAGRKRAAAHYDEADVVRRYRELYTESSGGDE